MNLFYVAKATQEGALQSSNWFDADWLKWAGLGVIILCGFCLGSYVIRRLLRLIAQRLLVKRFPKLEMTDLQGYGFFFWLSQILVFLIGWGLLYSFAEEIFHYAVVKNVLLVWGWSCALILLGSFVRLARKFVEKKERFAHVPLGWLVQLIHVVLIIVGGFVGLSIFLDGDITLFLGGLGAFSAVLLLVFKDSLVGLVAGIQITANDLVRRGDWICAGSLVDGTVKEVGLTSIRVENFDRTTVYVPTYKLVSESFVNWRTVTSGKGRRISRSILIDLSSIAPLTAEQITRLKQIPLLREYLSSKSEDLQSWQEDARSEYPRELTNLGTFRHYCKRWIETRDWVNKDLTVLVRQLQQSSQGLPLQLYFFTSDTQWIQFENYQSETFEHFFAMLRHFDLKAYQEPSGLDLIKSNQVHLEVE